MERNRHLRWLAKAEHWGDWLRFSETELAEPQQVWMMRHANGRVRFYEKGRGQVGPEHASIVAATCWAYSERFIDPDLPVGLNLAARAEVLAGGVQIDGHRENPTPPAPGEASRGDIPAAVPSCSTAGGRA